MASAPESEYAISAVSNVTSVTATKRITSALLYLEFAYDSDGLEGDNQTMSIHEEADLILKLYELRREPTMRQARDWFAIEFHPESVDGF